MSPQVNILLLSAGALQSLVLILLMARARKLANENLFLLFFLIVMLLQITIKLINKLWVMQNMNIFYQYSYYFPLLYGPLIFLFIRHSFNTRKGFAFSELLHFLPFAFFFSAITINGFSWIEFGRFEHLYYNNLTRLVSELPCVAIYHVLALTEINRHIKGNGMVNLFLKEKQQWLKQLTIMSFVVATVITIALYFMYRYNPVLNNIRFLFAAITVFVYWVTYKVICQPQILQIGNSPMHYQLSDGVNTRSPGGNALLTVSHHKKKYSNSTLKENEIAIILSALSVAMKEQKVHADPELTIEKLAFMLHTTRHNLSRVLNERMGQSFYDFINAHRVALAKMLLADNGAAWQKIATIAYECGFNSLSTFNDVFKKVAGTTPSGFREQMQKQAAEVQGKPLS